MWSGRTQVVYSSSVPAVSDSDSQCSEEDEGEYLGDGAYADWGAADFVATDLAQGAPQTEIVLFGADELFKVVQITATVEIGYLRQVVFDKYVGLAPKSRVTVPIALRGALSLHPRQENYVTRVSVELSAAYEGEEKPSYSQNLDLRYIAINRSTAQAEVMSAEVQSKRYPYGIVNNNEEAQEAAKVAAELARQGIHLEGVGSGVDYSTDDPEELAAFLAERTADTGVDHE